MQQKLLLGAVIAFIAIGVITFALYQQQEAQPLEEEYKPDFGEIPTVEQGTGLTTGQAPVHGNCPNIVDSYYQDLCWKWQALAELDLSLCHNIGELAPRVDCIEGIAREQADTTICEQEFPDNDDLLYHCIREIARDEADYSLCDPIPQVYKERCIRAVDEEMGVYLPLAP